MNHDATIRGCHPGGDGRLNTRRRGLLPLIACALTALLALTLCSARPAPDVTAQPVSGEDMDDPGVYVLPDQVKFGLPAGKPTRVTVTNERLLQGKLLLVDEAHPIPEGVTAPATHSVLGWAKGRIACRDLQAQLGLEALQALHELCVDARNSGIMRLTVFAGTRSYEQQRQLLNEKVEALTRSMPIDEAVAAAKTLVDPPGCAEHQLPYTVDVRITRTARDLPDAGRLADSPEGAWLLDNGWTYGFIQRYPDADPAQDDHRPYCFRYVGEAHAQLMHATGLPLEDYLSLLREAGSITLYEENAPVASAVCVRAGERHAVFEAVEGAAIQDASADNRGYAVISLVYP